MAKLKIFSNRSYIILYNIAPDISSSIQTYAEKNGYFALNAEDLTQLDTIIGKVQHCLCVFANCKNANEIKSVVEIFKNTTFPIHFIGNPSNSIETTQRNVIFGSPQLTLSNCTDFTEKVIQSLLHPRLKELCIFSTNYILKSFLADLKTETTLIELSNHKDFDVFISCESIAQGFFAGIQLKVNSKTLVQKGGENFKNLDHQQILDYMGEFANQVLGVVNLNLQKININARVGLPTVHSNQGFHSLRSGFYTPSCLLEDPHGIFNIKYTFLIPFMKDTDFKSDFETHLTIDESCTVEIF